MHMMKTFTKELKYNDIVELWCTIERKDLKLGFVVSIVMRTCYNNQEVGVYTSDDLYVYIVHSKDGSNYFNSMVGSSKGAGTGSSKSKRAAVEAIELDDEAVEDLGIDEGGFDEGGMGMGDKGAVEGGMGDGGIGEEVVEEGDNISYVSLGSEEERLILSEWDDIDENEAEIFTASHGDNGVAAMMGQEVWMVKDGQGKVDNELLERRVIMLGREIGGIL
ncbi:hypothetical protein CJ030_MR3G011053 [Morella rubra]|uniref:Uncharacterized protein n=1 Tax=Morella rubra TaxID=262757 RepID=A0A6A1W6F8_9ROSI|nr:hypothetical protein CJ030_MR3G011053 [Morella rubra]